MTIKHLLSLLFLMLGLLLVACGGGGDAASDAPAPTDAPAADTGDAPQPPEDLPFAPNITPQNTPLVPGAPFDGAPGGPVPGQAAVEDFSTLQAGQRVVVKGLISVVETEDGLAGLISDSQGVSLRVVMMEQPLRDIGGQTASLSGFVNPPSAEGQLLTLTDVQVVNDLPFANSSVPAFLSGTPNAPNNAPGGIPDFLVQNRQTLDFTVGTNLTALQSYDALVQALGDEAASLSWISAEGNQAAGWDLRFSDESSGDTITYTVNPDGTVLRVDSVGLPVPVQVFPIERSRVVVDSAVIEAELSANTSQPIPQGVAIMLRAVSESSINWYLFNTPEIEFVVDATTPR